MSWRGRMATAGMVPLAPVMILIGMKRPTVVGWIGCRTSRRAAGVSVEIRVDRQRVVAVAVVGLLMLQVMSG